MVAGTDEAPVLQRFGKQLRSQAMLLVLPWLRNHTAWRVIECPLPHCTRVFEDSMAAPVGFLLQLPRTFYAEAVTLAGGPETSDTPELVRTSTDEVGDPELVTTSE